MSLIKKFFPKVKVYTTGKNLLKLSLKHKLTINSYDQYLIRLIKEYNLESNIVFLGVLEEKEMVKRFLLSNVFVSVSSIENAPNSLGEAMLLGVPSVSSDVGGVKNMLEHNVEGFIYQADAPYMLAHYVCEIFKSPELANRFSLKSKEHAMRTHNREENIEQLFSIYNNIINN
jgi:glycosyltransferase involved in cell wall biosynthesis